MQVSQPQFDIPAIQSSWLTFQSISHLRPIHNDESYDQMVALMNSLLDIVGDDEDHSFSGLLELVGDIVSKYEQEHYAVETTSPQENLRFLIKAKGFNQDDLSSIVHQSNLSAILSGKRKISATLAGKLGKFFGVSPALFVQV